MLTCTKCGAILEDHVQFCTSCGTPMEATQAETCAPSVPDTPAPPPKHPASRSKNPTPHKKTKPHKRRKRRIKKRFFVFLALLLLLLGGTAILLIVQPWNRSASTADPYRGVWTASSVTYQGNTYSAAQLFPNGIPVLTVGKRRVSLAFSGNSGKGWRKDADGAITFSCLDKTYSAMQANGFLTMDMNGMTLHFTQAEVKETPVADAAQAQADPDDPVTGVWVAEAYRSDTHGPSYASDLFHNGCTITLASDGTGTITVDAYAEEVTWTMVEDTITITGTIMFPSLTLRDDLLYGTYGRSDVTLRFRKEGIE